jgi:hypothetical protein
VAASDDLSKSLIELFQLLTGGRQLDETLTSVASFAVRAISRGRRRRLDDVGERPPRDDRASAAFVQGIKDLQYKLGEGPCLSAVSDHAPQMSGSLGGDARWCRFGPRVRPARGLRERSQAEHIKLSELARRLIEESVRRARGRRADPAAPPSN